MRMGDSVDVNISIPNLVCIMIQTAAVYNAD